jgi:hypothetical protein
MEPVSSRKGSGQLSHHPMLREAAATVCIVEIFGKPSYVQPGG